LLQQFSTSQVRVIESEQPVPLVTVLTIVTVRLVQRASLATGSSKLQTEPHSTVLLLEQVRLGTSMTVTVWLQVALLLQQSVACQVWVIVVKQSSPLVTVFSTTTVTLVPQQVSEAAGSSKVQASPRLTVLLLEQVITGGVVSTTVTVWLHVLLRLEQSTASQVRVMVSEHWLPLVTVSKTLTVTLEPQQRSKAAGASKVQTEPHSTVLLVEQVMTGGVVSTVVTVAEADELPMLSVTTTV
jgi:hypothetical protein